MIAWKHIMLHCSATKDSGTVSWPAIRKFHIDVRGWNDIGYHYGVELTGDTYEALIGRSLASPGAHCPEANNNHESIGVCLVGDFEKAPPPAEQLIVLHNRILVPLFDQFGLGPKDIRLHREFAPWKTCPGTALTRAYLAQYVPGIIV